MFVPVLFNSGPKYALLLLKDKGLNDEKRNDKPV